MSLPLFLLLSFALWSGVGLLVLAALCWAASRRKPHPEPEPTPPAPSRLPDESPLDLVGYRLDSRFYGVIAESYR